MKKLSHHHSGFSLIELTLALGICGLGIVMLIALIPSALNSIADSSDRNAYARIRQAITSEYAMKSWEDLESLAESGETLYSFDQLGTLVNANDLKESYVASVLVEEHPLLSGDSAQNPHLRTLEIRVSATPEREDALTNPAYYEVLSASVAKFGR